MLKSVKKKIKKLGFNSNCKEIEEITYEKYWWKTLIDYNINDTKLVKTKLKIN